MTMSKPIACQDPEGCELPAEIGFIPEDGGEIAWYCFADSFRYGGLPNEDVILYQVLAHSVVAGKRGRQVEYRVAGRRLAFLPQAGEWK